MDPDAAASRWLPICNVPAEDRVLPL